MQHRLVTILSRFTADYACYDLWKVSADTCRSNLHALRFFVPLALLCFSVPQFVFALSPEEIIAVSAMQDSWPQLGRTFPEWKGDPSTACEPWYGITCDVSENIVKIILHYNQMTGTIPPQLENLKSLQILQVYYNQLIGTIPPQLGNLTSLQQLYLFNNQLSGTIPPELGNLTSLQQLHLNNNQLSGSIPPQLLQMNLSSLDVSVNDLSLCPPPSSTNFNIPPTCNLKSQSQDYCDPECTAFYSSLPCDVNFEVCIPVASPAAPDAPLAPTVPPVASLVNDTPDTPDTPAASPVAVAFPSISCPSQNPPSPSFSCIDGVWISFVNVSGATLQISSPTSIEGDLGLSGTLTFVGLDGSISVDGCVTIEGIEIVLSDQDMDMIKKSSKGKQSVELLKQGKTGCGTLNSIPLSVKHPRSCTRVRVSRDPSRSTHTSLAVLFKPNSTNCHLWWIICLSILGGIVIIALVFVLLATFNKRVKAKVRPFWLPHTQLEGISRYVDGEGEKLKF